MNLEFSVTGTDKKAIKASVLLAKSQQGMAIRQTEWPAWQRPRKLKLSHDELHTGGLHAYLMAMDLDESEADLRAINWEAYGEWAGSSHDPWKRISARLDRPELIDAVKAMHDEQNEEERAQLAA